MPRIEYKLHPTFPYTEKQKAWIEALASGEYRKWKRRLTRIMGEDQYHCCLGVACTLEKIESEQCMDADGGDFLPCLAYRDGDSSNRWYAPKTLRDQYLLRDREGASKHQFATLAEINDASKKDDFGDVITALCAHPEEYFINLDEKEQP